MLDLDVILAKKTGEELFKELYRVYPVADFDDYLKAPGNIWKNDQMKMDLELVYAHRREAGAPDPPALEDVVLPADLPATSQSMATQSGLPTAFGAALAAQKAFPGAAVRPVAAGLLAGARTTPAASVAAAAGTTGPVAELRLIALFVAKWKLDPTHTKMLLAKLIPARRRHVMQTFKPSAPGEGATKELDEHVQACEANSWADVPASPAPGAAATATPRPALSATPRPAGFTPRPSFASGARPGFAAAGARPVAVPAGLAAANVGVKRALSPGGAILDPSKRPRLGASILGAATSATAVIAPTSALGGGAAALAARMSARPRGPMTATTPLVRAPTPTSNGWAAAQKPGVVPGSVRPVLKAGVVGMGARPAMGVRPAITPGKGGIKGKSPF